MTVLLLFTVTLLTLILCTVPIAFALIMTGIALLIFTGTMDMNVLGSNLINSIDKYVLLAIPFFLLAGELMTVGGLSQRIVRLALGVVGGLRGGLGYVVVLVSIVLASLSGSAVADAAALASILLPMMRQAGYDESRSIGLVAAGGILGPVIPPSINLILFGVIAHVSIIRLFIGGIVPGVLMGLSLGIVWWWLSRGSSPGQRQGAGEIIRNFISSIWALLLPVIVVGGLRFGFFTPTETGVIAVFYSIVVGAFIYRELTWSKLYKALLSAAKVNAIVLLIVSCSSVLAWTMSIANVSGAIQNVMASTVDSPTLVMIVVAIITLLFGMVLDSVPLILILTPILYPIAQSAQIDPVYFGVVFIMCISIGLITPPVGNVLNVVAGVAGSRFENVVVGVLPFLAAEAAIVVLLIFFPSILTAPLEWFF